jgi:8-oxo-dGTP diphosphatase
MADIRNTAVIEAAGGVVERETPDGKRYAVIYRERYGGEWGLPKGKRETGESWQDTALREVEEELGLTPTIVGVAGAAAYLAQGRPKLVLYWRMRFVGEPPAFQPNEEVAKAEWLPRKEAADRLTHRDEAAILRAMPPD